MTRRGLLLTITEPPAAMEEEFNAWYDTERFENRPPWSRRCLGKPRRFAATLGETIVLQELGDWRIAPPPGVLLYRACAP